MCRPRETETKTETETETGGNAMGGWLVVRQLTSTVELRLGAPPRGPAIDMMTVICGGRRGREFWPQMVYGVRAVVSSSVADRLQVAEELGR